MFWPKQLRIELLLLPLLLLGLLHTENVNGFIVPQELQSALSLVYSNIPPIKKGTDSRVGFGFRLGDHADFQVLLELGPQKETRPLGQPNKDDQSFNKRQVSASEQREHLRQQQLLTTTERNAASWLENWSNGMKPPAKSQSQLKTKLSHKQAPKSGLPTRAPMPKDAVQQLQLLYKMATEASVSTTSTVAPPTGGLVKLAEPSAFRLPPPALAQDSNSLGNSKPIKDKDEVTKELMDVSLEA